MMGHLKFCQNLTNIFIFRFTKCEYCHAAASERRQESNLSKKMMHRTDASLLTALHYTDIHTVRERETEIWNNMLFHSNRSLPTTRGSPS